MITPYIVFIRQSGDVATIIIARFSEKYGTGEVVRTFDTDVKSAELQAAQALSTLLQPKKKRFKEGTKPFKRVDA